MGDLQQRIIAMSGVIVFFLSSIALSAFVIIELVQGKKDGADSPDKNLTANNQTCEATGQNEEVLQAPEPFTTTEPASELQTTDLQPGNGKEAANGDCLVMKYYGTLASTGDLFDENFTKPTAFAFTLGSGQVIQGWEKGLAGLKEGGTRRIVIPASLGYGEQGQGEQIPPNSDLVFVVKLLRIQK